MFATSRAGQTTSPRFGWHMTRAHAWVFAGVLLPYAAFCSLPIHAALLGENHSRGEAEGLTAGAVLLGPLAGGIARDWQSCCARASLDLLPVSAALLGAGMVAQFAPLPNRLLWKRLRLCLWAVGWVAWFGGGLYSLGHALE